MAKFVLKTSPFFVRLTSTFQLYNFMKHFISLIVLASLAVAPAYADTRSDKEMLDIARNAFAHPTSADNNIKRQVEKATGVKVENRDEFYDINRFFETFKYLATKGTLSKHYYAHTFAQLLKRKDPITYNVLINDEVAERESRKKH